MREQKLILFWSKNVRNGGILVKNDEKKLSNTPTKCNVKFSSNARIYTHTPIEKRRERTVEIEQ